MFQVFFQCCVDVALRPGGMGEECPLVRTWAMAHDLLPLQPGERESPPTTGRLGLIKGGEGKKMDGVKIELQGGRKRYTGSKMRRINASDVRDTV